jgi:hypothetical protein
MDTNVFSLDEIRRELNRFGYDGVSKQTLLQFQRDLVNLARNDQSQNSSN